MRRAEQLIGSLQSGFRSLNRCALQWQRSRPGRRRSGRASRSSSCSDTSTRTVSDRLLCALPPLAKRAPHTAAFAAAACLDVKLALRRASTGVHSTSAFHLLMLCGCRSARLLPTAPARPAPRAHPGYQRPVYVRRKDLPARPQTLVHQRGLADSRPARPQRDDTQAD